MRHIIFRQGSYCISYDGMTYKVTATRCVKRNVAKIFYSILDNDDVFTDVPDFTIRDNVKQRHYLSIYKELPLNTSLINCIAVGNQLVADLYNLINKYAQ